MENKKVALGQFFTKHTSWAKPQIVSFIQSLINEGFETIVDPFAGGGDLLNFAVKNLKNIKEVKGYDIDESLEWEINDSLCNIPVHENAIILTNPPYLASYSAKRKGMSVYSKVEKYFLNNSFEDLYQVALNEMLEKYGYVVAIIPETFINSSFPKDRLKMVTILESEPFEDTECPVCVACFVKEKTKPEEVLFYKNNTYSCSYEHLLNVKKTPSGKVEMKFNSPIGKIALKAVDNTKNGDVIKFMPIENLEYDVNKIKVSSRLITVIEVPGVKDNVEFSKTCNEILEKYRKDTFDILLSPFKGNRNDGIRRRRLDYKTARAIIEEAFLK